MWNCDEIGFDPNGKWHKVVCNYKFFQGEIMWKVKTRDCATLLCTLLVFKIAEGKCFMPPVVVHQAKEYSKDIHKNIPFDWKVYHTPSGYMYIDRWLKTMTQLFNICSASLVKNQIIFFYGHDSHFDDHALKKMQRKNIQTFIIKAGDSINDQPNENGPNSKLKSL